MQIIDLGLTDYRACWQRQLDLWRPMVERKRQGLSVEEEYILLTQHRPVYTLGVHGDPHNMLLTPQRLKALGAELIPIERGGDITFHGPGQLVVYPILDLERHHLGLKDYVNNLEESVIRTLADYGITAGRVHGATGVWLGIGSPHERKICAIGVKCSRFVTMHGLALNISTDLSYFHAINPCGFADKGVTSLAAELAPGPVDFSDAQHLLTSHFISLVS